MRPCWIKVIISSPFLSYWPESLIGSIYEWKFVDIRKQQLCLFKAYVEKFKFRSVLAEDALEFYLEYFPDLKEKNVHKIEGKEKDH